MSAAKYGFEFKRITLPLSKLLPVRHIVDPEKKYKRYSSILASIPLSGIIEPLMVFPQKGGMYLIMDGHLRYHALKALKIEEVECLISTDDESFTYNARISRLAPIQEHKMITRAVKNGVSVERIATALHMDVRDIKSRLNLLRGVHEEAAELLKDKEVSIPVFWILRRVTSVRQIEIAELMVSANNFSKGYADGLFMGTSKDQLVDPGKPKTMLISAEEIAKMEAEMEVLERDFKAIEEGYAENMLNLTVARGYVKKLIDNVKIVRFLSTNYADVLTEFEAFVSSETL